MEHWIWKDPVKLKWWLDILMTVNFKDAKILIGNQVVECKRGQSLLSLQSWADRWKVDKSKVRRFFILLQSEKIIDTESVQKTTRLTVLKYDSYQSIGNDDETKVKHKRNDDETIVTPIEESKEEIKKGKKVNKAFIPPSLSDVLSYFEDNGYTSDSANKAFSYYQELDWYDSKNNKVKNWKSKMISVWFKSENKKKSNQTGRTPEQQAKYDAWETL